jgi:hypothetical protein
LPRQERIARPTATGEWELVAADKGVAENWERWAAQEANALAAAYDQLTTDPTRFSPRQKKLEGKTWGTGTFEGKTFDRWQYEATSGGRIFYFVDDPMEGAAKKVERTGRGPRPRRRVIIEAVHPGHPKGTERRKG